ncbi:hypothetical protein BZL30_5141 [Mycobacterium kansasii]|uniref:Uncharacterized protein n=1 Tax=Mycobacterium kansasii TaxID=1768 RepID=A0A1V3X4T4_MYCKA|nr:hypothetical protein BZL30_5141 [Mycobacterium kansasii]
MAVVGSAGKPLFAGRVMFTPTSTPNRGRRWPTWPWSDFGLKLQPATDSTPNAIAVVAAVTAETILIAWLPLLRALTAAT